MYVVFYPEIIVKIGNKRLSAKPYSGISSIKYRMLIASWSVDERENFGVISRSL